MADMTTGTEPSDADLIARVRGGDNAAYGLLFDRHVDAARRLARGLSPSDADDLVSEAFTKVLALLQAGKGPDEAFRAYLLTSVRRLHVDRARSLSRTRPTDDEHTLDSGVEFVDPATTGFEHTAAAEAFAGLPERWQLVLWHLEVEGQKPADIAPLLGMSANSVSALAYRAREGLKQAYLTQHLNHVDEDACRTTTPLLSGYVRKGLSARDTAKVEKHLDGCRACTGLYLELLEVNSSLGALLAPVVLGAVGPAYVAGAGSAAWSFGALFGIGGNSGGGAAGSGGLGAGATVGAVAAGVVVTAVAAVAVVSATRDSDDVATAPRSESSATSPEAPSAPAPAPSSRPKPSPAPSKSAPPPAPAPSAPTRPAPAPTPKPAPTTADPSPSPSPTPKPTPKPTWDYSIGDIRLDDVAGSVYQRSLTIPVDLQARGKQPATRAVKMRMTFDGGAHLLAISDGWTCTPPADPESNSPYPTEVLCEADVAGDAGFRIEVSLYDLAPGGSVTIDVAGDSDPSNNTRTYAPTPAL